MKFTHREDLERKAWIESKAGSASAFVVNHTDAKGKARKKTFNNGFSAALRFLLNKEGYIVRAPQEGPVLWMTKLRQDYVGELYHCVDRGSGDVWLVDSNDNLHRIEAGSCKTEVVPLGTEGSPGRAHVAAAEPGAVWILTNGGVRLDGEYVSTRRLLRAVGSGPTAVAEIGRTASPTALTNLSSSAEGYVLGPHGSGAALYNPDGGTERQWSIASESLVNEEGRMLGAIGALSTNGRWVAWVDASSIRFVDLESGASERLERGLKTISRVQIADDGSLFVSGFRYPSHGVFRHGGEFERVSKDTRATIAADGKSLVEAEAGRIVLRDTTRPSEEPMQLKHKVACVSEPALGMAKYGRAAVALDGSIVVLTDAYTIAGVDMGRVPRLRIG